MQIAQNKDMKFLKAIGLGVVYIVLSPFILLGIVLISVYGIMRWLIYAAVGVVRFFKGEKFFKPLQEDIDTETAMKVYHDKILAKEVASEQPAPQPAPQTTYVQNNYYNSPNQEKNPAFLNNSPEQLEAPSFKELPTSKYEEISFNEGFEEKDEEPFDFPEEGGDL